MKTYREFMAEFSFGTKSADIKKFELLYKDVKKATPTQKKQWNYALSIMTKSQLRNLIKRNVNKVLTKRAELEVQDRIDTGLA